MLSVKSLPKLCLIILFLVAGFLYIRSGKPDLERSESSAQFADIPKKISNSQNNINAIPAEESTDSLDAPSEIEEIGLPRYATAWSEPTKIAELDEFQEWTERFSAEKHENSRRVLVEEGVILAKRRRPVMKELIVRDPESALAHTVPAGLRQELPEEVTTLLEERISGVGRLDVKHVDWIEGKKLRGEVWRTASINGTNYNARTFGRRLTQQTLTKAYLHGIVIEEELALSDSPVRVSDAGEQALILEDYPNFEESASTKTSIVAQVGNQWIQFADRTEIKAAEERFYWIESNVPSAIGSPVSQILDPAAEFDLSSATDVSRTLGPKQVIVLRLDFPDMPGIPTTPSGDDLTESFIGEVNLEISDFYAQYSFGNTSLEFTIAPEIFRVGQESTTYMVDPRASGSDALRNDLYTVAGNLYDLESYDHVIMVFPYLDGYPGGMAGGHDIWISGFYQFRTVAHEIGHNYGWGHANLWVGTANPIDFEDGFSYEYGDPFDVMGIGNYPDLLGFAVPTMKSWGWLTEAQTDSATADNKYRIYASDRAGLSSDSNRLLGVEIQKDDSSHYWITFRGPSNTGTYEDHPGGLHVALLQDGYTESDLIVLNSAINKGYIEIRPRDILLSLGSKFTDPNTGVTIHLLSHEGTGRDQYVDVEILFHPTAVSPEVGFQPADQLDVRTGSAAVFSTWARAGQPSPTYRWQRQVQGTGEWTDLSDDGVYRGTDTPKLVIDSASSGMSDDIFRCWLENSSGSAVTESARLTVIDVTSGSYTLAGMLDTAGFADGKGIEARFHYPWFLDLSPDGSLYVSDAWNDSVRKVTLDGMVSTVPVSLSNPAGLCFDAVGNLYIADNEAAVIRRYSAEGISSVYAGRLYSRGSTDGELTSARFHKPTGLTIDSEGNLYVADVQDHTIRKISPSGQVTTLAGTPGQSGYRDGAGNQALFYFVDGQSVGLCIGPDGALYVTDFFNHCVRRIDTLSGVVSMVKAPNDFYRPLDVVFDSNGTMYVSCTSGIYGVSKQGFISSLTETYGSSDGIGMDFGIKSPSGMVIGPDNRLFIADANNNAIRVYLPTAPIVKGNPSNAVDMGLGGQALFSVDVTGTWPLPEFRWQYRNINQSDSEWTDVTDTSSFSGIDDGELHIQEVKSYMDGYEFRCQISNGEGEIVSSPSSLTVARNGIFTVAGSPANPSFREGLANDAGVEELRNMIPMPDESIIYQERNLLRQLLPSGKIEEYRIQIGYASISGIAQGEDGSIYYSDSYFQSIKKILPDRTVEIVAGPNAYGESGAVDGDAASARFDRPSSIARAPDGTLYVYDEGSYTIRKISPEGQVSTLAGSVGLRGTVDGHGEAARLESVHSMKILQDGTLAVLQVGNLRFVSPLGEVETVGNVNYGMCLANSPDGTIYISDYYSGLIRTFTGGYMSTLRDDSGEAVLFDQPNGIVFGADGVLYLGEAGRNVISGYIKPPKIVESPSSTDATYGSALALQVDAADTPEACYQWYRDGVALPGETSAVLNSPFLDEALAGEYRVEVWNRGGFSFSDIATISVSPPSKAQSWLAVNLPSDTPFGFLGLDADADFDGITNLMEYSMGLNPGIPDHQDSVGYGLGEETQALELDVRCRHDDPALTVICKSSSDLNNWSPHSLNYSGATGLWSSSSDQIEIVTQADVGNGITNLKLKDKSGEQVIFYQLEVLYNP
jgi:streptogramin lyase